MSKISSIIKTLSVVGFTGLFGVTATTLSTNEANAGGRYATPPATRLSPDLASPWILQLGKRQIKPVHIERRKKQVSITRQLRQASRQEARPARIAPIQQKQSRPAMPAKYLPQEVSYKTNQKPGTLIISTEKRYLYLVLGNGKARRYGVGVGREGFTWSGVKKITRRAEWPGWTPPKEMIARQKKKGIDLPAYMPGGPDNPLGARALYLGSTLYRIHGTTQPWTIGTNVSSGCIRMRNEDVIDLYTRVKVGTKVIVL